MSAPIQPPPKNNNHFFDPQHLSTSGEHRPGPSWWGNKTKKGEAIGGHHGFGAAPHLRNEENDEENFIEGFMADKPIREEVEQQIDAFIPSQKSTNHHHQGNYSLNIKTPGEEEGNDSDNEPSSHHHNAISNHFSSQGGKIARRFESHNKSLYS